MTHKQEVPVVAGDIANWTLMCVFPGQMEITEAQRLVGGVTKSNEEATQELFVVIGSLLHHVYCRCPDTTPPTGGHDIIVPVSQSMTSHIPKL